MVNESNREFAELAAFYKETGYALLERAIEPEMVQLLRDEADSVLQRIRESGYNDSFLWGGNWMPAEERGKKDVTGAHDVQYHSAAFLQLLMTPRILDCVEALIGPNIQLHHTKLIVKPPEKGAPFPMHQDCPYFPHELHTMLAVSIYLDDADIENGCIRVVPGSHKLGQLPTQPDGLYLDTNEYPIETATPVPAKAGDAAIFNYLTIHGSGLNTSSRPRRNVLIQFRAPNDRPTVDTHRSHAQGMMLRGINPLSFEARENPISFEKKAT